MGYKTISKDRKFLSSEEENGLTSVSFEVTNFIGLKGDRELSLEAYIQSSGNAIWIGREEIETLHEFLGIALKEYDSAKTEVSS